jgi:hypothetical protein
MSDTPGTPASGAREDAGNGAAGGNIAWAPRLATPGICDDPAFRRCAGRDFLLDTPAGIGNPPVNDGDEPFALDGVPTAGACGTAAEAGPPVYALNAIDLILQFITMS